MNRTEMVRDLVIRQEYHEKVFRSLCPKTGEVAVGGSHIDYFVVSEALRVVIRSFLSGDTIGISIKKGKEEALLIRQKWNESRRDYQVHRPNSGDIPELTWARIILKRKYKESQQ